MTKHTPGPWAVGAGNVNAEATVDAEHTQVCTCHHHCVGSIEKEMHANAALIAAAPDLLAALIGIADFAYEMEQDWAADVQEGAVVNIAELHRFQAVREAIAKATKIDA